jgi:quinol monooxygenase YgiN
VSRPEVTNREHVVFVRFHAIRGQETAVEALIRAVVPPTRAEPGNLAIAAFRSVQDAREFYIHSRWRGAAAFEAHAELPHTRQFIEAVLPLLDHELKASRTSRI